MCSHCFPTVNSADPKWQFNIPIAIYLDIVQNVYGLPCSMTAVRYVHPGVVICMIQVVFLLDGFVQVFCFCLMMCIVLLLGGILYRYFFFKCGDDVCNFLAGWQIVKCTNILACLVRGESETRVIL